VAGRLVTALGLVSVVVGIVVGIRQLLPAPSVPGASMTFVLDVSPAMRERFGGGTKLAAAETSILQSVAALPGIPTSLRLMAGGCEVTAYEPPTLAFSTHDVNRYRDVFDHLEATPQASYIGALAYAVNDFTTTSHIDASPHKLVVLFLPGLSRRCQLPVGLAGGDVIVKLFWLGSSRTGLAAFSGQLKDVGFRVQTQPATPTPGALHSAVARAIDDTAAASRKGSGE
jgi:hypothetical protein